MTTPIPSSAPTVATTFAATSIGASAPPATPPPAEQLTGVTLPSGWKLVQRLSRAPGGTGSNFGVGYVAERGDERAFVKAIDFYAAIREADPIAELGKLISLATFEREAMELCGDKKLSRLVRLISHEYVNQHSDNDPMFRVYCLVMEVGAGDLRKQLTSVGAFPPSVVLRILADVALGLAQLHRHGVSHQDVKPSNIISMTDMSQPSRNLFKVADLGRVVHRSRAGPYDGEVWPGDPQYAPPERYYRYVPPQWSDAREASDCYMLGSLVFFLFVGVSLQPLLFTRLPAAMLPGTWKGGYLDPLIQVIRGEQFQIITQKLAPALPDSIRDGLIEIVKELVEPDPSRRGDKKARRQVGNPVGLDRFQPRLNHLALHASVQERVPRP